MFKKKKKKILHIPASFGTLAKKIKKQIDSN